MCLECPFLLLELQLQSVFWSSLCLPVSGFQCIKLRMEGGDQRERKWETLHLSGGTSNFGVLSKTMCCCYLPSRVFKRLPHVFCPPFIGVISGRHVFSPKCPDPEPSLLELAQTGLHVFLWSLFCILLVGHLLNHSCALYLVASSRVF